MMKVTTRYTSIERVIHEFGREDVKRVLMKAAGIPEYQQGKRVEFMLDEDGATITVIHEQPQEDNT